jgi:Bacterial Ig-like domain (group 1)
VIRSRRSVLLAAGILGLSLLSCGREVTGPENGLAFGRDRFASLALAPQFPRVPGANAISDLVPFERVRITLRRADGVIAKDTLVAFPSTADSITLAIDVPLPITAPDSGVTLRLSLAYVNTAGDTVFRGGPLPITARRSSGTSQPISIPVNWVPPGGIVPASVELTPATGTAVAGTTTTFTAVARDGQGQPIAGTPIFFSSADTLRARVANVGSGLVTWLAVRGTARIIATLPNGPADTSAFDVSLPASRLLLVAGDGQSATINSSLPQPLSFRVTASDTVPVAGMPVTFTVTTGGGTLGALADTSDATGLVSTSWTLGALVGAQSVTATVTGVPAATRVVTATGLAPVPTQLAITAAPTTAVAGSTFTPVIVEVRDAGGALTPLFAGPVSVALDPATAGGATLAGTTTVNAVAGIATFADLSIARASTGLLLIATSAGLTPDTSAALSITTGAAAALTLVSGDGQAGVISAGLPLPFVVRVTDAFTNPVPGVTVNWAIASGGGALSAPSAVTDALGNASVTLTTGAVTGASTVTATVAGLTGSPVTFTTTVTAGAAASLAITSGPIGAQVAGVPLAPVVLEARDAGGNLVTGFTGQVVARAELGGVDVDSAQVSAVAGVASFVGESFETAGTYLIRFSAAGLTDAVSNTFVVAPAAAAAMTLIAGNAQSGVVSTALADSVAFRLTDAFGNPVPNVGWTIAVTGGGGSVSPAGGNTDAAGEFRTHWTLGAAVGAQSINAFVTAQPTILAGATATATSGAATQLVITSAPLGTRIAGAGTYDLVLEARDAAGNLVTSFIGDVVGRIDTGPFIGSDSSVAAAVGGIATFSTQPIELAGTYTLRFTAAGLADAVTPSFDVIPAAAATIVALEGNSQSTPALTTLADSLGARVEDAFGNAIAGVTVTWTVTSGGGSIAPATSITGINGVARAAWTLGGTVGTQNAQAEGAGFTTGFTASATATDANVVWTGAINANWSEPGNWSGGVVPVFSDSVRIVPGTPNFPRLDLSPNVGRLRVDAGATLQLDTFPLLIQSSLVVEPGASVLSDSLGTFVLIGTGTVQGAMPRLAIGGTPYALAGDLTVNGDLTVTGGSLSIAGFAATVGGTFATVGGGRLVMNDPGGSLLAQGDAVFAGGSTLGMLVAGTLTVRGDFTQAGGAPGAFSAGIGHTVVLDGPVTQTVTLLNPDAAFTPTCAASCFGTLRSLRNAGTGTLQIGSDLKALATIEVSGEGLGAAGFTLVSAGTPSLTADVVTAARVGWQDALVRSAGSFLVDTLVAWGTGTLIASETVPTVVLGPYALAGTHTAGISVEGDGSLAVGGTALVGSGTGTALRTRGNGRVLMQDAADSLAINGSADFGGTTIAGTMNAGVLGVTGDLTQTGTGRTLFAEGAHLTRLLGANGSLTFADTAQNQLAGLSLDGAGAVTIAAGARMVGDVAVGPTVSAVGGAGRARIGGGLVETIGNRWQMPTTQFDGVDPTLPPAILGDVVFMQGVVLDGPFTGNSGVTVAGGALDVAGQRLQVSGALSTVGTGTLRMVSPADTVVTFNASFAGADSEGQLTAGRLDILGNFSQAVTGGAFRAGPGHETWFLGNLSAAVDFAAPGFGADSSHFGTLYLSQPLGAQVSLLNDVYVNGLLENGAVAFASQVAGSGQRIISRGAEFSNLQFNNVRWQLVDGAPVTLLDSLTFSAMVPDVIAFEVIRSGGTIAIPNLAFSGAIPTTGRYLRVEDSDGAAGGILTIELTNVSPETNGGFLETVNGAVVNGWPNEAGFTWTGGATTSDWNNTLNWSGGAVPTATDSVFVPGALLYNPVIPNGTVLRSFVSARTESAISAAGTLAITGHLAVPIVGGLDCSGALSFANPSVPMTARGRVACFTRLLDGTLTVSDSLGLIGSDLQVEGTAILDATGGVLVVDGPFSTLGGGRLRMQNDSSHVALNSGASFGGGSTAGLLTAGLLEIGGNFTQSGDAESFSASGGHVTDFHGSGLQQAVFGTPGSGAGTSHFAHLVLGGSVGVQLNSDVYAAGQLRDGAGAGRLLTTASGAALVTGGASFSSANLVGVRWEIRDGATVDQLSGISFESQDPTVPQFSVIRSSGTVTADNLSFDTPPTSGVYILVDDPDGATNGSSVLALSSMLSPAAHAGFITELNTATITGWSATAPFIWTGAEDTNWEETNNWLNGAVPSATDSVTIAASAVNGPDISAPTTLRALVNESATVAVTLQSQPLTITERLVTQFANVGVACSDSPLLTIAPTTAATVAGHVACDMLVAGTGTTTLTDSLLLGRSLVVGGSGQLDVNGQVVRVLDSLATDGSGTLRMTTPGALVDVQGAANFHGGSTAGLLTDGMLLLRQDLVQAGTPGAFAASGAHVTRFSTEGVQAITFANPGSDASSSHFADVEVAQSSSARLDLHSDIVVLGQLRETMALPAQIRGDAVRRIVTAGGASLDGIRLDRVLLSLVDGAAVTQFANVTFDSLGVFSDQLVISRSAGAILIDSPTFVELPQDGYQFMTVTDVAPLDLDTLRITMVNPTPAGSSGLVTLINGAQLVGWPAIPPMAWTGGGGNSLWSNPANWSLGRIPIATDSVVIDQSATIDLNESATVAWLLMGLSSTPTLNLNSGATLQVDSAAVALTGTTVNMATGSTLTGNGAISLAGTFNWNGGTMSGTGGTLLAASGTASIATSAGVTLDERILAIGGTATLGAGAIATAGDPAISVGVGGTLEFAATNSYFVGGGTMDLVNSGTIRKSASAGTVRIDWPIANVGTIEVEDETFDLRGTFDHVLGSVVVQTGAALQLGGETQAAGGFIIADGGAVELRSGGVVPNAGNHRFTATSSIIGAGWLRVNAADTVQFEGTIDVDSLTATNALVEFNSADTSFVARAAYLGGGNFRGTGVLAIRNAFTTAPGNLEGTGIIAILPGATFETLGPIRGWNIDVAGTMIWGDYSLSLESYLAQPARIDILSGGLLDIQHGATARDMFGNAGNAMTNAGTIQKLTGSATALVRTTLTNTGNVNGASGTLSFQFGCTNTGTITGNVTGTGCTP